MKKILSFFIAILCTSFAFAQNNMGNVWLGEVGVTVGAGHYFGDLNTRAQVNRPKPTVGLFFKKQFGDHLGARLAGRWVKLGYSDTYNTKNDYQKTRNLSFNTNVWEVTLQGDFYFYKYDPTTLDYIFTPYVTLGIGAFSYDPYAYLQDEKVFLRPLGTEGQNENYMGRKPYGTMTYSIPFGVGLKYNISPKVNVHFEVLHRFTGTDYLDDVSTTYAGIDKFTAGSTAALMQDRSYEIEDHNTIIGMEGSQRGWSKQKDQFTTVELGFSFNITTYRCPTVQ